MGIEKLRITLDVINVYIFDINEVNREDDPGIENRFVPKNFELRMPENCQLRMPKNCSIKLF